MLSMVHKGAMKCNMHAADVMRRGREEEERAGYEKKYNKYDIIDIIKNEGGGEKVLLLVVVSTTLVYRIIISNNNNDTHYNFCNMTTDDY